MNVTHPSAPEIGIIGGGPAGMGCALWLKQKFMDPLIIERDARLGGQARLLDRVNRWYLGFPQRTSLELATVFSEHIHQEKITVALGSRVLAARKATATDIEILIEDAAGAQRKKRIDALVLAAGTAVRGPEIFGECAGAGFLKDSTRVFFFPTDHLSLLEKMRGAEVAVVGGNDNAHFTTNDIAPYVSRVHLIMRSKPGSQSSIRRQVEARIRQGRVREYQQTVIRSFDIQGERIALSISDASGKTDSLRVDWLFVRAGSRPATESIGDLEILRNLRTDSDGYVVIDSDTRTSVPGVYAIGDVARLNPPSLITAAAQGAVAACAIEKDLREPNL